MTAWDDVLAERQRQDERWGEQDHDPVLWMVIIAEEVGEASEQAIKAEPSLDDEDKERNHLRAYREELVHVAAVAIAAVEAWDRAKWEWDCLRTKPVAVGHPHGRFSDVEQGMADEWGHMHGEEKSRNGEDLTMLAIAAMAFGSLCFLFWLAYKSGRSS